MKKISPRMILKQPETTLENDLANSIEINTLKSPITFVDIHEGKIDTGSLVLNKTREYQQVDTVYGYINGLYSCEPLKYDRTDEGIKDLYGVENVEFVNYVNKQNIVHIMTLRASFLFKNQLASVINSINSALSGYENLYCYLDVSRTFEKVYNDFNISEIMALLFYKDPSVSLNMFILNTAPRICASIHNEVYSTLCSGNLEKANMVLQIIAPIFEQMYFDLENVMNILVHELYEAADRTNLLNGVNVNILTNSIEE